MSILVDQLQKALDEEIFVDVYRDELDEGESICGYVTYLSDDFVCLMTFSERGLYDGLTFVDVEDITRLRMGSRRLESEEKLVEKNAKIPDVPDFEMPSFEEIIEQADEHFGCVTVFVENIDEDMCFIGEVEEIDEDHLVLKEFGTMSKMDRQTGVFRMDDITRVDVDGEYERNLQFLHGSK